MTDKLREAWDALHDWIRDEEIPMSDQLGRICDSLEALASATPAQATDKITYSQVMIALALVPHDLSHPDRCRWIAAYLNQEPALASQTPAEGASRSTFERWFHSQARYGFKWPDGLLRQVAKPASTECFEHGAEGEWGSVYEQDWIQKMWIGWNAALATQPPAERQAAPTPGVVQAVEPVADMFWLANDRESFGHDIDEIVADCDVGCIVKIDCAARLPSIFVKVIEDPTLPGYLTYEEVTHPEPQAGKGEAAPQPIPGSKS